MDEIKKRNVVVLGHQGSGKTSLIESMYSVAYDKPKGNIDKGTTISDYLAEEKARKSSCRLSVVPVEYKDYLVNLIDIPGNDDFIGEAIATINVVKGAILVIDASSGVEVETVKHWNLLRKRNIPTLIYVNKMDKENVHFENVLAGIREKLGKDATPFCYPMGHNDSFDGYINVVALKARKYNGKTCEDSEIYPDKRNKVLELHNTMVEAVASTSEELMEKFFSGETLTNQEIQDGLRKAVLGGELIPVLVGSAQNNITIHTLLDMLIDYLPNPSDLNPFKGLDKNGNEVARKTLNSEPFSAFVFKTTVDSFSGVTSIFKVNSGSIKVNDEVYISKLDKTISVNQLFTICGSKLNPVQQLTAGDIGAICKVDGLETSMTLSDPKNIITYKEIEFPSPVYYKSLVASTKADDDKLGSVLQKIQLEDKSVEVVRNPETNELIIATLGLGHLNYILEKMKNAYKLVVNINDYKVTYRETIKGSATGEGRYIKQSGGSGFYGVVVMDFKPAKENIFREEIFGGAVPKNYFPAVEKGFFEACEKGLLAGCKVIGVEAVLKDGKYHTVDSNELAFKMAAILAFKDAYMKCKPVLLEPIIKMTVTVHPELVGTILSDLNSRRGKILNMDFNSVKDQKIEALVPESEILEYVNDLKSMTQGSGYFMRQFYSYEEAPQYIADKLLKELNK